MKTVNDEPSQVVTPRAFTHILYILLLQESFQGEGLHNNVNGHHTLLKLQLIVQVLTSQVVTTSHLANIINTGKLPRRRLT